ncbi:MAG: hypothetical protein IPK73_17760 [Candidatus Obscuribacter sp.]|nr:hypothetical protein [Candidatus Obscuribacter sp.]MBK9278522.1 hypothetical protein [Candidatus Obscuribacter sp.]
MHTLSKRQPRFWRLQGKDLSKSELVVDESVTFNGRRSCLLQHDPAQSNERSVMVQTMGAIELRQRRLCFSAKVKTENVEGKAALFVCILDSNVEYLLKDEMPGRELSGCNDWTELKVVIDVPELARYINFGAQIIGAPGKLWISDLSISEVSLAVPPTENGEDGDDTTIGTTNLDFSLIDTERQEPLNWLFHSRPRNNNLLFTKGLKDEDNRRSLWICSKQEFAFAQGVNSTSAGTFSQVFNCVNWRGKRVRFSADIKCKDVGDWCGLLMRVTGIGYKSLAYSTMYDAQIGGNSGWGRHSLVLDVSPVAWRITLGATLEGNGEAFFSNLSFDEADSEDHPTDRQSSAKNLDFAE